MTGKRHLLALVVFSIPASVGAECLNSKGELAITVQRDSYFGFEQQALVFSNGKVTLSQNSNWRDVAEPGEIVRLGLFESPYNEDLELLRERLKGLCARASTTVRAIANPGEKPSPHSERYFLGKVEVLEDTPARDQIEMLLERLDIVAQWKPVEATAAHYAPGGECRRLSAKNARCKVPSYGFAYFRL